MKKEGTGNRQQKKGAEGPRGQGGKGEEKNYTVLFCAAEVFPFAKVGGLADVAGALPESLSALGNSLYVAMPFYKKAQDACKKQKLKLNPAGTYKISMDGKEEKGEIFQAKWNSVNMLFVAHDGFFGRDDVYGYHDDLQRFTFFSRSALEAAKLIDVKPDVIHAHDWHASLIPCFLRTHYKYDSFFNRAAAMYTIHNLAYQGVFEVSALKVLGFGWEVFTMDQLEFYGRVNAMKGGIVYSDAVSTVSEKYMEEIQTPEYGEKLDGLLRSLKQKLHGITNGIDLDVWNPKTDKAVAKAFDANDAGGKTECKRALQKECGFPETNAPLFSMVTRLADQKGLDILAPLMEDLLKQDAQFVILGTGTKNYEALLDELSKKYPEKLKVFLKFDDALSHRIYAGGDFFVMPSRFEPCGLGQLIAMRYGTLPVARKTGGLSDTVTDFEKNKEKGNGVVFEAYTKEALSQAFSRALKLYKNAAEYKSVMQRALAFDASWENSARKYLQIYETIIEAKRSQNA